MNQALQVKNCPKCGSPTTDLVDIDTGMRAILQKNGGGGSDLPAKVCSGCYNALTNTVSQGVKLRIEQQAKEKNRQMVWKSRVNLIRHARQMMSQKSYSEAAVSYEKYIRVLEISYDLKPGQLAPEIFGSTSRSKELTIVATTYWDLLRIYDVNPKYRDRMALSSRKLAQFLPFSPIYPDVIKKAQEFVGQAKNPDIIRDFLKQCKAGSGRCFIATAAFNYPAHPTVQALREFRDRSLVRHPLGRFLIRAYYILSPPLAAAIRSLPLVKPPVRWALNRALRFLPLVQNHHRE